MKIASAYLDHGYGQYKFHVLFCRTDPDKIISSDRQTDGWTDGRTDGWKDRQTDTVIPIYPTPTPQKKIV